MLMVPAADTLPRVRVKKRRNAATLIGNHFELRFTTALLTICTIVDGFMRSSAAGSPFFRTTIYRENA
jgi:hypothetical protein